MEILQAVEKYLGCKIVGAYLDEDKNRFQLEFEGGSKIFIYDETAICCERRYISFEDNPDILCGGYLQNITQRRYVNSLRERLSGHRREVDEYHEQHLISIIADEDTLSIYMHNDNNGDHHGFNIQVSEK